MRASLEVDANLKNSSSHTKISNFDEDAPQNINEYQFLRAVWTTHRCSDSMSVDDRLDRLNKVVAMVRGNLSHKYGSLKDQPRPKAQN